MESMRFINDFVIMKVREEKSKDCTQTLLQGKGRSHKERFFNPILQNEVHIK